jgi:hypothetical protein
MARERILITVKTYPTLSRKYGETVCTAGMREDGSWVRVYPVPFRRLEDTEQYRKFDWLECDLIKKVRAKYLDEFNRTDLHFFLGTTQQFHFVALNPWVIIGVFPIPHERQMDLI